MKILSDIVGSLLRGPRADSQEESDAVSSAQEAEELVPRRILVLGVSVPAPVTSFLWTEIPDNISIADFDTVILDLTQFEKPETTEFANAYLPESPKFARLFFRENSEIIVIGRPDIQFDRTNRGYRAFQYTSWWMPQHFPDIESSEHGIDFKVESQEFASYLDSVRHWSYFWTSDKYVCMSKMYCPQDIGDYLAHVNLTGNLYNVQVSPIAKTRFGGLIAFKMRYLVFHGDTDNVLTTSGSIIFLPPPTVVSTSEAITELLCDRYGIGSAKQPPSWVQSYSLPWVDNAQVAMQAIQCQIDQLKTDYERVELEAQHERRFLGLLYEQGDDGLEPLVREALYILGAKVIEPTRRGQEDGRLIDPFGRKAVLEIKGRDNQLPLKDVRQLVDWVSQLTPDGWNKGILIANLFRNSPPSDREDVYASNSLDRASKNNLALLTTTQLFSALKSHQAGTLNPQKFWDALFEASGPCALPELG
jgi:hypothetical protein